MMKKILCMLFAVVCVMITSCESAVGSSMNAPAAENKSGAPANAVQAENAAAAGKKVIDKRITGENEAAGCVQVVLLVDDLKRNISEILEACESTEGEKFAIIKLRPYEQIFSHKIKISSHDADDLFDVNSYYLTGSAVTKVELLETVKNYGIKSEIPKTFEVLAEDVILDTVDGELIRQTRSRFLSDVKTEAEKEGDVKNFSAEYVLDVDFDNIENYKLFQTTTVPIGYLLYDMEYYALIYMNSDVSDYVYVVAVCPTVKGYEGRWAVYHYADSNDRILYEKLGSLGYLSDNGEITE